MGFPKQDAAAQALFDELLPDDEAVQRRPMFGHVAAFVNGHMFMGTFGEEVIVRLDDEPRQQLLRARGASTFEPMAGRPMREYVVLPRAWRDRPELARPWIDRAFAWAKRLPPKPKKPSPKKPPARRSRAK